MSYEIRLYALRSSALHAREGKLEIVAVQGAFDFAAGVEHHLERADVVGSDAKFLHGLAVRFIHRVRHLSAAGDIVAHFLAVDTRTEGRAERAKIAERYAVAILEIFDDHALKGFQASRDVHLRERTAVHDAVGDVVDADFAREGNDGEPPIVVLSTEETLFYF